VTSRDVYLPDCFGFGYALPSIAAHCGLKGFSTQKLGWGCIIDPPFSVGRWEGPDGKSIVAAIDPGSYTSGIRGDLSRDGWRQDQVRVLKERSGVGAAYAYFGVGDTGGAPDAETVDWLDRSIVGDGPLSVVSTGADQLFRDLTPEQAQRLPAYKGELLMTTHGTGCYTSQSR
jgi:alpha-mannosidase